MDYRGWLRELHRMFDRLVWLRPVQGRYAVIAAGVMFVAGLVIGGIVW